MDLNIYSRTFTSTLHLFSESGWTHRTMERISVGGGEGGGGNISLCSYVIQDPQLPLSLFIWSQPANLNMKIKCCGKQGRFSKTLNLRVFWDDIRMVLQLKVAARYVTFM